MIGSLGLWHNNHAVLVNYNDSKKYGEVVIKRGISTNLGLLNSKKYGEVVIKRGISTNLGLLNMMITSKRSENDINPTLFVKLGRTERGYPLTKW